MEPLWGSVAFKATAFNHSAISPVGCTAPLCFGERVGFGCVFWPPVFAKEET